MNLNPDVMVIGAGAAGVAAAYAVSSAGSSVLVIEKNTYPGGKATASYVGTVCGIYLTGKPPLQFCTGGFPRQFAEKLMRTDGTGPVTHASKLHFIPYQMETMKNLCSEFLNQPGTEVVYDSIVEEIRLDNGRIDSVILTDHVSRLTVRPGMVVDASGETVISDLAKVPVMFDDNPQAAAQVFTLGGFAVEDETIISLALVRNLKNGIQSGKLSKDYERVSLIPGSLKNGNASFKIGVPFKPSSDSAQRIIDFSQKAVADVFEYISSNSEVFRSVSITFIAPEAGIRTGNRNRGEATLTVSDVTGCRKHADGIAKGSWPVEFWPPGENVQMKYFDDNDWYEIPAGCLKSAFISNLFFGGRNISADDQAIASARVIGTCLQTGFAAGILAHGQVRGIDRHESISHIRREFEMQ